LLYESREGILVVKENIRRSSEDAATSSPDDGAAAGNVPYVERRLAAILSADVKDYSRLMGNDDVATVETLTAYRETMTKLISQHRGRVVDSPGDNLLAEFSSVVAAVQCSVGIQEELTERNADLSVDRRMEFRIGVNLGEVIIEGDRIYGDGVNIAARVQELAEGGGVCISGSVCDEISSKLSLDCESLGAHTLKNIDEPVRVYRVQVDSSARGEAPPGALSAAAGPELELGDKPSVAVLPFANMSDDPEQEHFTDGITDDIITDLAKIRGLAVVARNSAFTYKNRAVKIPDVGRELGVRYVLEGSVRKVGDQVRITAQLVDAVAGHHLWAERYDRDLNDIFGVQDEISQKIAIALKVILTAEAEAARAVIPRARVSTAD
jgi:TolB-like protein